MVTRRVRMLFIGGGGGSVLPSKRPHKSLKVGASSSGLGKEVATAAISMD